MVRSYRLSPRARAEARAVITRNNTHGLWTSAAVYRREARALLDAIETGRYAPDTVIKKQREAGIYLGLAVLARRQARARAEARAVAFQTPPLVTEDDLAILPAWAAQLRPVFAGDRALLPNDKAMIQDLVEIVPLLVREIQRLRALAY